MARNSGVSQLLYRRGFSAVPSGLIHSRPSLPNVETLGYFHYVPPGHVKVEVHLLGSCLWRGELEAVFVADGDDGFGSRCLAWRQAGEFFEAFFEAAWGDEDQVCGGEIFDVAVGVGDVAGQKGGGVAFEGQGLIAALDFEAAVEDEKSFVFAGMDVKRDRGLGRCSNLDQGQGATGLVGGDQETVGGAEDVVDGAAGWWDDNRLVHGCR